jgi:hypothetical protein
MPFVYGTGSSVSFFQSNAPVKRQFRSHSLFVRLVLVFEYIPSIIKYLLF